MTDAHEAEVVVRFIERWPDHEPRESDPNYKYFNAMKRRLHKQGLMKCAIDSTYHHGQLEIHHAKVEFAHAGDVDIDKFNDAYGLHMTDSEFARYIEEEGNAEVLCALHHRGQEGVHSLPSPEWNVLRVAKADRYVICVEQNTGIPTVKDPDFPGAPT